MRRVLDLLFLLCGLSSTTWAADFAARCADREAIERVYYQHRMGTKPPFEQTLPRALLENMVRQEIKQETALQDHYGVTISPALVEAEVNRINTTTRAPGMLAEIKAALADDPARFARAFARPILVGRLLREKFENDDKLHAAPRQKAETVRNQLLTARNTGAESEPNSVSSQPSAVATVTNLLALLRTGTAGQVTEMTWQLGVRPATTNTPSADELEIKRHFGPNAQLMASAGGAEQDRKLYFEDLAPGLRNVLRAQLRQAGDVSAVIETPSGFLLYLATEKTQEVLTVACLSLPKRSYEQWLEAQQP